MKKIVFMLFVSLALQPLSAQKKAITDTGYEVILYNDGTWVFSDQASKTKTKELALNPQEFTKSKEATFLLKSTKVKTGLWLNPNKWRFSKAQETEDSEYILTYNEGDIYGLIINEKVEIPLEFLKNIVLDNAKTAAPDAVIKHEEYRMVNGIKVMQLDIQGTIQGIRFSYFGYYYSNKYGTTQLLLYTSQNLMESYRQECEYLLNGLVEIE